MLIYSWDLQAWCLCLLIHWASLCGVCACAFGISYCSKPKRTLHSVWVLINKATLISIQCICSCVLNICKCITALFCVICVNWALHRTILCYVNTCIFMRHQFCIKSVKKLRSIQQKEMYSSITLFSKNQGHNVLFGQSSQRQELTGPSKNRQWKPKAKAFQGTIFNRNHMFEHA